jgi:hypothetical protein
MSSFNVLHNRLEKIEASLPPQPKEVKYDASLLTEQEREQVCAFFDSLPYPRDAKNLSDEQLDESRYWLKLSRVLSEGDAAEADKLRRQHGVTLELLVDRFLNLDLSSLPVTVNGPWPHVQEYGCTYSMSRTDYRHISTLVKFGCERRYSNAMWRWIDFIESRAANE